MAEKNKTLTDLEFLEKEIIKYVEKNEVSPFARIEIGEDGKSVEIDMDQEFEKVITENIENVTGTLGQYFENIIRELVEKIEAGEVDLNDLQASEEIEDTENLEDQPQGIPEAP